MFSKKLMFKVNEMEAIDFCKMLGKYKLRFTIGPQREITLGENENRKKHYREFTVYASRRKAKALSKEINKKCYMENYI